MGSNTPPRLAMFFRTSTGCAFRSLSHDGGATWHKPPTPGTSTSSTPDTSTSGGSAPVEAQGPSVDDAAVGPMNLPNPNTKFHVIRLQPSGHLAMAFNGGFRV